MRTGRAGVNASFISEAGNDRIGEYVIQFLRDNGVVSRKHHLQCPILLLLLYVHLCACSQCQSEGYDGKVETVS